MLHFLRNPNYRFPLGAGSLLGACLFWAYWPALADMGQRWAHEPQYSHGFLVPVFAVFLLGRRWNSVARPIALQPSWWGLAFLAGGLALHLGGSYLYFTWIDYFSLLPCLAGVALLVGGWGALQRAWPSIAFLLFMLPLPYRVETALAGPLRRAATITGAYVLQTLGFPALADGNVIVLNQSRIWVADACSGLSVLLTFFMLTTAVALVVRRPLLDKVIVLASTLPIALLANVVRITVTALAMETLGREVGSVVFHDLAGWLMIPLALVLLWLELRFLNVLLIEPSVTRPMEVEFAKPAANGAKSQRKPAEAMTI
jgi:exosortase